LYHFLGNIRILLSNKVLKQLKKDSKRGFHIFLKDGRKTFFKKLKSFLKERERKRGLRGRLEKCPFGRLLGV